MADQSPTLEKRCSVRFRARPLSAAAPGVMLLKWRAVSRSRVARFQPAGNLHCSVHGLAHTFGFASLHHLVKVGVAVRPDRSG